MFVNPWQQEKFSISVGRMNDPMEKAVAFGTTGGHYHNTWARDNWRTTILNAIVWTCGVEVPKDGVPSIAQLIK
jgi:hypothetical protein